MRYRKIPNIWILVGIVTAVAEQYSKDYGIKEVAIFVLHFFSMAVICFPLWWMRAFGAGDIKVLSVLGGTLGIKEGISVFVFSLFVGAVGGVLKLCCQRRLTRQMKYAVFYLLQQRGRSMTGQYYERYEKKEDYNQGADFKDSMTEGGHETSISFGWCILAGMFLLGLWRWIGGN